VTEQSKQEFINIYRIVRTRYGSTVGEQVASLAYDPDKMPPQIVEEVVDALTARFDTPALAKQGSLYPELLYPTEVRDHWVLVEEHEGHGEFIPDLSD
jgi:hypothetical protein